MKSNLRVIHGQKAKGSSKDKAEASSCGNACDGCETAHEGAADRLAIEQDLELVEAHAEGPVLLVAEKASTCTLRRMCTLARACAAADAPCERFRAARCMPTEG